MGSLLTWLALALAADVIRQFVTFPSRGSEDDW